MIGTHVPKRSTSAPRESEFSYSSPKYREGQRGVVNQIAPNSSSRESDTAYSRRIGKKNYIEDIQRKTRMRRIAVIAIVGVIALIIACIVGVMVYFGSISSRMSIGDERVGSALSTPQSGAPYYILVSGEYREIGKDYDGPDSLMLVRVDTENNRVALISVPASLRVTLKDNETHRVADAQLLDEDSYLIEAVSTATGVSISHYVKTDETKFVQLVDALGGIEVTVEEEVDDPKAGEYFLAPGLQVLDGDQALTFSRARNYAQGIELRDKNQSQVLLALATKLFDAGTIGTLGQLDLIADMISTDVSVFDALSLIEEIEDAYRNNCIVTTLPGTYRTDSETRKEYFSLSSDDWKEALEALSEGKDPTVVEKKVDVDPQSFSIIIRNGSGITGGASQFADALKAQGFKIEDTGNADSYVYEETLVVYKDDKHADSAQSVVDALESGRVVASNGFYSFDSDVLVVVGKDWKPVS